MIHDRTRRAVEEAMTVVPPDMDRRLDAGEFLVVSESESEYQVTLGGPGNRGCECEDMTYRPETNCKHIRRVLAATGRVAVPACLRQSADPMLGEQCSGPRWRDRDRGDEQADRAVERGRSRPRADGGRRRERGDRS